MPIEGGGADLSALTGKVIDFICRVVQDQSARIGLQGVP